MVSPAGFNDFIVKLAGRDAFAETAGRRDPRPGEKQ
jgi:hypothetical protein